MLQAVYRIKQIHKIRFHFEESKKITPYTNDDFFELMHNMYEEMIVDDVKIISAFENYLKAVLLESGYIIHETKINKPVKISDGLNNSVNLKKTTHRISTLLNDDFWPIYGLLESDKTYLSLLSKRRNSIHFLLSKQSYSPFDLFEEVEVLKPLIKGQIAYKYKSYCKKLDVKHNQKLIDFEFLDEAQLT